MELLPKDVLLMMAIDDMDYLSIINLCKTNPHYNTILCNNPDFWRRKLQRDYPNLNVQHVNDYKGLYIHMKKWETNIYFGLLSRFSGLTKYLNIDGIYGIRIPNFSFRIVNDDKIRGCEIHGIRDLKDMLRKLTNSDHQYDDRTKFGLCQELEFTLESMGRIIDLT